MNHSSLPMFQAASSNRPVDHVTRAFGASLPILAPPLRVTHQDRLGAAGRVPRGAARWKDAPSHNDGGTGGHGVLLEDPRHEETTTTNQSNHPPTMVETNPRIPFQKISPKDLQSTQSTIMPQGWFVRLWNAFLSNTCFQHFRST